jgi:RHS repeat-associated protein
MMHSAFSTGKERDAESGLDYFGARYYASTMGRFTSADPYEIVLRKNSHSSAAFVPQWLAALDQDQDSGFATKRALNGFSSV